MKIGFMTNSLAWAGLSDLDQIGRWAAQHGFEDLEVGPGIPLNEKLFADTRQKYGIQTSAFIYCRNFFSPNAQEAQEHRRQLLERIRFAPRVGADKVICSTGVSQRAVVDANNLKYDPEACVEEVAEAFKPIVEEAEKQGVRLCFENCPLMGNIAISPYMWDILFARLASDNVGLAYDPSHFVWQFMDPYQPILDYRDKIFHVHGKDCEVQYARLRRIGILHNFSQESAAGGQGENALAKMWWRYRLVGLGDLDWRRIVANLEEIGFDGTLSIEHEDPVWEGSLEKVETGLLKAQHHLKIFMD